MDLEAIYVNVPIRNIQGSTGPQTLNINEDDRKQSVRSRCLLLMMVSVGLLCVLLLLAITLQHINITAERDLYKNTVEELNHTIAAEKDLYKNTVEDLNHTISSLQHDNTDLRLKTPKVEIGWFFTTAMNWSESRQYCIDHGADLVIIKSKEKQKLLSSLVKERMWIGLSAIEIEGNMTWVDNSPLNKRFWYKGEPNYKNGNQDCVEMMFRTSALNTWKVLSCSRKIKGICEKNGVADSLL